MQLSIHQTHHTIGDFRQIFAYLENTLPTKAGLHLYPELFLTGYPLLDLCLQRGFIDQVLEFHTKLDQWAKQNLKEDALLLVGGLDYRCCSQGLPKQIFNAIWGLDQNGMRRLYCKRLLPNHDIFDEQKYFSVGDQIGMLKWQGKRIGLLICEDMWHSNHHHVDPVQELSQTHPKLDLVVNLSASPYHLRKNKKRVARAKEISHLFKAPFVYVNRVGGEDEILFDGQSFVVNADQTLWQGHAWRELKVELEIKLDQTPNYRPKEVIANPRNTWESLFYPAIEGNRLIQLTPEELEEVHHALIFALREYAHKCHFNNFLVAVSGGIDSAVVLTLAKLALHPRQKLEAIYMPSSFSSSESYDYSAQLCKNLDVPIYHFPIKFTHSTLKHQFKDVFKREISGLSDENIQSRIRAMLLYTRSNQTNAMVINTSNKSELAVGYSTQYGDSVGAISLLGDLYKSEVFALAKYINQQNNGLIPNAIIARPPSAELRKDQTDEQSLPPYDRLDTILEGLLSYHLSMKKLQDLGLNRDEIIKVHDLLNKSEYKRRQFCPIVKIKSKSFGFGYRVPICKK